MRVTVPVRFPRGNPIRPMYRSGRTGKFRIWPLLLFALFFVVYYSSHQETVPITGRSQLVDMSRQQELALGIQSFQQVLAQSDIVSVGPEVDFVRKVANLLTPVIQEADFDWDFRVIRSEQANAFALPGGKVAVYTGILPIVENEDGLAAVLGHEIAHAVARHGAERLTQQKLVQWASFAVSASVSDMDYRTQQLVLGALGAGSQFGVLLPFSRRHESEADHMGLIYMARACFDPHEAPRLWERMNAHAGSGQPLEFVSTHPSATTRIAQFQEWMPEAEKIRDEFCAR
ncbi:MAG: M48 family metallopeptidase [Bdellovibrionales bacterium]|nr:M48 family metallopeptidase [Bdellovibrionales bacterium]